MKKIVAIILVMLCCLTQTAFASEVSEDTLKRLYDLEIMVGDGNGNLRLDDNITRAEAAKVICVAGGLNADALKNADKLADVSEDAWEYKYAGAIIENGYMTVSDEGTFDPEGTVTNEEIIAMIVELLGYEPMTMAFGGGTAGCVMVATQLGITKGMQFEINAPSLRGDVAIMINRALDVPLMVKADADGGIAWKILDGEGENELVTLNSIIVSE